MICEYVLDVSHVGRESNDSTNLSFPNKIYFFSGYWFGRFQRGYIFRQYSSNRWNNSVCIRVIWINISFVRQPESAVRFMFCKNFELDNILYPIFVAGDVFHLYEFPSSDGKILGS